MRFYTVVPLALAAGCAMTRGATAVAPLETEGELYLYLLPSPETAGPGLRISGATALLADGTAVPLALELDAIEISARQRLVARGRLAPHQYAGIELQTAKQPLRVDAPFSIDARRATVLWLAQRPQAQAISLTATTPPKTVPALSSFCTDGASHDVVVFDKHLRSVTAAMPTGRSPWGITLDPVQGRGYVALADDDQIAIFDIANGRELSRIRLSPGDSPRELITSTDRRMVISANAGSNTVSLIDPLAMTEIARVQVGEQPISLLQDRNTARFYVFNARSSSISVVDPAQRKVVATVQTENSPLRGQLDRAGTRLYVASSQASYLTVYSVPALSVLQRVYVGVGTTALKVDPDTDFLYVATSDGRVSVFDPFSLLPLDYFDAGGAVTWMAIDGAENVLFMLMPEQRSVAAMQLTTRAAAGAFDVGPQPRVLVLTGERN